MILEFEETSLFLMRQDVWSTRGAQSERDSYNQFWTSEKRSNQYR